MQESVGLNNLSELCDGSPCQSKIIKGDGNFFLRAISILLTGTKELHIYTRIQVTKLIKSNRAHIKNEEA